jgi:hypothetical protein
MEFTGIKLKTVKALLCLSFLLVVLSARSQVVRDEYTSGIKCNYENYIIGLFSPCSPGTISRTMLKNDIVLKLNEGSSYKVISFEVSYDTKEDSFICKAFTGYKAVYKKDDNFWKRIDQADVIFIDEIRVIGADNRRAKLPSIVKYVK